MDSSREEMRTNQERIEAKIDTNQKKGGCLASRIEDLANRDAGVPRSDGGFSRKDGGRSGEEGASLSGDGDRSDAP
jgi:hypothetical protein